MHKRHPKLCHQMHTRLNHCPFSEQCEWTGEPSNESERDVRSLCSAEMQKRFMHDALTPALDVGYMHILKRCDSHAFGAQTLLASFFRYA